MFEFILKSSLEGSPRLCTNGSQKDLMHFESVIKLKKKKTNVSRTARPTKIQMRFLSFSDNLLQDAYIIFQYIVNTLDCTKHAKSCRFVVQ